MNYKFLLFIFFAVILTGCKKETDVPNNVESKDTFKSSVKKDTIIKQAATGIFEGLYTVNVNTSSFQDCANPDSMYWVIDNTKKLREQYRKIFASPNIYGSVLIKVKGELTQTEDELVKEKFPRTLVVKEFISMEKKNFSNVCVQYDYWGFGSEPNWTLEISEKENIIEFYQPAENKTYYFFYEEPKVENDMTIYQTHNEIQKYVIEIRIKKIPCSDIASGKNYDYSVEVDLTGNKKYRGCGIKGKLQDK